MTIKLNCWEFEKCGREPCGTKIHEHGVCPAAIESSAHGINGGTNGGRICWAIAGTLCNEKVKGTFANEKPSCLSCDFFILVNKEEDANAYEILTPIQLNELRKKRKKK